MMKVKILIIVIKPSPETKFTIIKYDASEL